VMMIVEEPTVESGIAKRGLYFFEVRHPVWGLSPPPLTRE
jgi:hypothetical protein